MSKYRAILIAGPTASGKSQLALDIAEKINGIIVNADSMQVYEDLSILTARPSSADLAHAPHALYGFVPGDRPYSVGQYVHDAERVIGECLEGGHMPILVGGTGLYFRALLDGLSPIPPIPRSIRQHWRSEAARLGAEQLHLVLTARDREMAARLEATDKQRIVRALEVLDATGQSLADWQRIPGVPVLPSEATVKIVIDTEREVLYRNCENRFDNMLASGALDEVARLAAKNFDESLPIMRALGVQPLLAHLRGRIDLATAVDTTKVETRHYIKRQLTWLKSNMIAWNWIEAQQMQSLTDNILPIVN
ncbi:MAG: tRNA (adenosine(37)-N6)-dimethylallyltransferase MiaA [Hyphomicrobiales bacterium]|nr:tRNA (adenosine(37)-N6)-dimethylallyltransferase MiaA [Hyphomicrobiales bacterium]